MVESISLSDARKLVLHSQKALSGQDFGRGINGTLNAICHLGYIQIDTISVVARAHHHVLWSRVPTYQPGYLDQLQKERKVFEYWSHAAAYLPMDDYRYSLPRMRGIAEGEKHWFDKDHQLTTQVMERIKTEGPLQAKDFEHKRENSGPWWDWKPAKKALEQLFMEGELMVTYRKGFQKVYDLAERVLPASVNTQLPTPEEQARYLIKTFLKAQGLGNATEINYQRKGLPEVRRVLKQMHEAKEVMELQVNGETYYSLPESLALLSKPLSRKKLKILSPFDNLVIQRKRLINFFQFDYQIECYTPEPKRKFGYFSLPILWNGQLVARMDAKASRADKVLIIRHLALEPSLTKTDGFVQSFVSELKQFAQFNQCETLEVQRVSLPKLATQIKKAWKE